MRILPALVSGLLIVAAGVVAWAAKPAAPAADKPPKYIRYSAFRLSFDFPAKADKERPVEVQLHVSEDRGETWKRAEKKPPGEKQFVFRAAKDGEYWFMCRTKYASGQYLPGGPPGAEIKIIVDTAQPLLDLTAKRGVGGEVHVCWTLSDAHLAPESFKIAYQLGGPGKSWQNVALDPPSPGAPGQELKGEIAFLPQGLAADGGAVTVRAEASDRAGNHTVAERPVIAAEDAAESIAQATHASASQTAPPPAAAETLAGPRLDPQQPADRTPPEMADRFPGSDPQRTAFPVAADEPTGPSAGLADPSNRRPPPAETARYERTAYGPPEVKPQPTEREPIRPPVAARYPAPQAEAAADEEHRAETVESELLPPGIHPHMVNKQQFELLYDVESVGSAGIAQIELWGTNDGGQHWLSYGFDDDARSPMLVNVDGEGLYGFRVVVKTGAGLEGAAPKSGDAPDVWVGVDLTKPLGNLISAEQGGGEEAGELVIAWEAADERLAPRPISLRMSESPQGPWHTIASGLENTGHYAWRLDQRTPQKFFLRLEVRDEAGNLRIDDSTEPVTIERFRPQGRIRDVRSAEGAGRNSRTTHNLLK